MTAGGTYTLVFSLPEPTAIAVGALGEHRFPAGGYCYTGSALGSGGFSRIDRHRRVAAGEHDVKHWHVDYLGGHPETVIVAVERVGGRDAECAVARELGDGPVPRFGASDCHCESHLARFPDAVTARAWVGELYEQFR
jgi:Uri superfamily endonuclease